MYLDLSRNELGKHHRINILELHTVAICGAQICSSSLLSSLTFVMLKHGIQTDCLRHVFYLYVWNDEWISPPKAQVSILKWEGELDFSWRPPGASSLSFGHPPGLGGAEIPPRGFHGQFILCMTAWRHLGTYFRGISLLDMLDYWISPEAYTTPRSLPVPSSVRCPQWWGTKFCTIGGIRGTTRKKVGFLL